MILVTFNSRLIYVYMSIHWVDDWKVNELLHFSFTLEINDYWERKDYLVYWNLHYLDLTYPRNDSS